MDVANMNITIEIPTYDAQYLIESIDARLRDIETRIKLNTDDISLIVGLANEYKSIKDTRDKLKKTLQETLLSDGYCIPNKR